MYKSLKSKIKSRQFAVIRRRYSLLEVPRRGIHNVIALAMSMFNNTPHSVLKRHSLPQGAREQSSVGRSMIEMLGVLAIIAVLSVGGIAGYSKAMEKFKVNKAAEEYAYLIRGLLEYLPNLKLNKASSQESLVEFALASNLIPPTWTAIHENKSLLDTYGNNINIFSRNGRLVIDLYLGFQTNPSYAGSVSINFPSKLCVTLFENLVIPLKESLYYAYYINNPGVAYYFYGNNYCSKGRNCLNNLKLNKVNELCSYCPADKSCGIILEF